MEFYKNISEIEREKSLIGYVRPLQRVWDTFSLDLVLCVDGTPTLFFSERKTLIPPEKLVELHRQFWNQGIASVLVIKDPKTVYILSALQPPENKPDADPEKALAQLVVASHQAWSDGQQEELFQAVSNGEFYRRYNAKFRPSGQVDQNLSQNLRALSELLTQSKRGAEAMPEEDAHHFICRLLFTCYLVDRGIYTLPGSLGKKRLHAALADLSAADATTFLYRVFRELKEKFNGSMFDRELEQEKALLAPHMERVVAFLKGDEMRGRQRSLGFWAYDFRLIPIETISGIYENFLKEEEKKIKGAHYTPRFLAEMTLDAACEARKDWDTLRYIDPSCGSGIFIVTLFNRLATAWELKNKAQQERPDYFEIKDAALRAILKNQIRGMDINPSACTLACFSLYVALLDSFEPSDIEGYIKKTGQHKLPKLLKRNGNLPDIPVIHQDDSLTTTRFSEEPFDVVIGNPPWGGTGRGTNDPSIKFLEHADHFLKPGGMGCLLLPSKIFLNLTSDSQQAKWLESHILERVIQLADYGFILFPTAIAPCMLVRFTLGSAGEGHAVTYDTPKVDLAARRKGYIHITPADRKAIPQAQILCNALNKTAHTLWKQWFWGSARDQRLIRYLEQFETIEDRTLISSDTKQWQKGEGFNLGNKAKQTWWQPAMPYISARSKTLSSSIFLLQSDCNQVGDQFPKAERPRANNSKIFDSPHVLISHGFGKVVFCDFPVLFQHTLQAIHGPQEDEDLLLFLTAYLQSDLALYYCFHTSSKLGIERDVVRFDEVLKLPFPLPDDAPGHDAHAIVKRVAGWLKTEKTELEALARDYSEDEQGKWQELRRKRADKLRKKIEPWIFKYFDILPPEQMLVQDTVHIFEPSSTPPNADNLDLMTLISVADASKVEGYQNGLVTYAETLTATLNGWAAERNSEWRVNASGWIGEESGLAMVKVVMVKKNRQKDYTESRDGMNVWTEVYDQFREKFAALQTERQMLGFLGQDFFVLRPLSLIHWTRSQSLNDADEFFAEYTRLMGEFAK